MIRMEMKQRSKSIPAKTVVTAIVIGAISIYALGVHFYPQWQELKKKQEQTTAQANQIIDAIVADAQDGKIEPLDAKKDAWGYSLQITINTENNTTKVVIVSPGPDGKIGTRDDLVVDKEAKKRSWLSRKIWG